jgi:hypothetical protein
MANPRWHAAPTAVLTVVSLVVYPVSSIISKNLFIAIMVILLGFLVDIDHLPFNKLKQFLMGGKWLDPNHVNIMHTWYALAGVIIFSAIIGNCLPLLSYAVHILIDGGSRTSMRYPKCSPLPRYLYRFYPRWLTYETGLGQGGKNDNQDKI